MMRAELVLYVSFFSEIKQYTLARLTTHEGNEI